MATDTKRTATIYVRITPTERRTFEQIAALQNLRLPDWVRNRLRTVAEGELSDRGKRAPWSVA